MIKKPLFWTACLTMIFPFCAVAGTSNKVGFKFGAQGFGYHNEAVEGAAALSSGNHGFGWSVFAGYRFNDLLGARIGYRQLADTRTTGGSIDLLYPTSGPDHYLLKAYDAVVTLNIPLGYCTDVTVSAGGAAVNQDVFNKVYISDSHPLVDIQVTRALPEVGVGMHFQHNRLLATEWAWTHIHGLNEINNIDMFSFGITLTIPM